MSLLAALPLLLGLAPAPAQPAALARWAPASTRVIDRHAGRYLSGARSMELRAARGYLYAVENPLEVPTNVMFFPQGNGRFTAFDPAQGDLTRLRLGPDGSLAIELQDGRRISAKREARP